MSDASVITNANRPNPFKWTPEVLQAALIVSGRILLKSIIFKVIWGAVIVLIAAENSNSFASEGLTAVNIMIHITYTALCLLVPSQLVDKYTEYKHVKKQIDRHASKVADPEALKSALKDFSKPRKWKIEF